MARGHTWVMDTLLCPPLLSSSFYVKLRLLLKGKKAPDSVGNQCPTPVWLLGTTREKVEPLLCLGLCFLLGHCSRKVALQPDRCTLAARDDNSTMCPAGNTPRWVSLVELDTRGVRFENGACLVTPHGRERCHLQIHWCAVLAFYILRG